MSGRCHLERSGLRCEPTASSRYQRTRVLRRHAGPSERKVKSGVRHILFQMTCLSSNSILKQLTESVQLSFGTIELHPHEAVKKFNFNRGWFRICLEISSLGEWKAGATWENCVYGILNSINSC